MNKRLVAKMPDHDFTKTFLQNACEAIEREKKSNTVKEKSIDNIRKKVFTEDKQQSLLYNIQVNNGDRKSSESTACITPEKPYITRTNMCNVTFRNDESDSVEQRSTINVHRKNLSPDSSATDSDVIPSNRNRNVNNYNNKEANSSFDSCASDVQVSYGLIRLMKCKEGLSPRVLNVENIATNTNTFSQTFTNSTLASSKRTQSTQTDVSIKPNKHITLDSEFLFNR